MKNYEAQEQQTIQVIEEPEPPPFWQTEWMWTGVIVPIVIAWIAYRKTHKGKDDASS